MKQMSVENFGPIQKADIAFGDLTVFVGPQASGKSLFVQLLKAVKDAGAIRKDLKSFGFDWLHGKTPIQNYCSIYFGSAMSDVITDDTRIRFEGKVHEFRKVVKPGGHANQDETVFVIPAQRVMVLQDGWPRPFMGYAGTDSYCVRKFSESVRLLMEDGRGRTTAIFPQVGRLKTELRSLVDQAIYVGAELKLHTEGMRKQLVLLPAGTKAALPFSLWSAGQREFTPLLLGFYWLMPSASVSTKNDLTTVVIEEPEMGLHPQAIVGFGLLVLELLLRGYQVVLSTHSPVILDLVWAIQQLKAEGGTSANRALRDIFGLDRVSPQIKKLFDAALAKEYHTFFFERQQSGVVVRDISSLDPGDSDPDVSGWGGLSGFSGRIAEIVGNAVSGGNS